MPLPTVAAMQRNFSRMAALALLFCLPACGTTAAAFVDERPGFSVTRGRLTNVDDLSSSNVKSLSDGVVFAIDDKPCRVVMQFGDGNKRVLELRSPDMLVCGATEDYILQPAKER